MTLLINTLSSVWSTIFDTATMSNWYSTCVYLTAVVSVLESTSFPLFVVQGKLWADRQQRRIESTGADCFLSQTVPIQLPNTSPSPLAPSSTFKPARMSHTWTFFLFLFLCVLLTSSVTVLFRKSKEWKWDAFNNPYNEWKIHICETLASPVV